MPKTLEDALPVGVIRSLSLVESETGLSRSSILARGVSYRATNDSVVRGPIAHKGFVKLEEAEVPVAAGAEPAPEETSPAHEQQAEPAPNDPHPVD